MKVPAGRARFSPPLLMRILVRPSARRHPYGWGGALFAAGGWLVILGGIACSAGYWWGTTLIAAAAVQFWAGYVLLSGAPRSRTG